MVTRLLSAKREAEGFGASVEELDLKPPVADRSRLTDQQIHPRLNNRAVSVRIDVGSVGWPSALTVKENAKPHGRAFFRRSHHEVHIARVELVGDPAFRTVEGARVGADSPVSRESPMVELKVCRRRVGVRFIPRRTAAPRVEP